MLRKPDTDPMHANRRLTNACTCLQAPGHLVRFNRLTPPASLRSHIPDKQPDEYSSPVCYAHLREFREGFD
ncbi:hypothetical protein [Pontibacter virosus]|uniref:Uncharacterized protein n=1 Tax=Pontibacter virosus TaxID=1765052 RepID=A0A2U1ATG4_9BACT|nr:hypothetical protein [Pontibacter virosus]PVY39698.1 hypothetical protein C8E01_11087 [Pontibacter virosus]